MRERHHVALVGMAGVGKSAVGSRLARRLGRRWVDLDRAVERRSGRSVAEVFAEDGEDAFREFESAALADELGRPEPAVLSTGGGVVLREANRSLLAERAVTVWLRADPDVLVERLRTARTVRPLLAGDVDARVRALLAERAPAYESVSDVAVDASGSDLDRVVDAVIEALGESVPAGAARTARRAGG